MNNVFELVFLAELIVVLAVRAWYGRRMRVKKVARQVLDAADRVLMLATFVGFTIVPLVYLFTPWLDFADYQRPDWLGWSGVALVVPTIWLFWRAHVDLRTNWSPTLEVREQHELVTLGVYRLVRHPMYAAIWLWAASQALLLSNWLAGLGGLATFAPMYFLRVPREERMMREAFGDSYAQYAARTGRIVPPWPGRR
jgi:protein-S-isoprenylcysteine O-methyltransferase Ste14